jgi:hypothetical protein
MRKLLGLSVAAGVMAGLLAPAHATVMVGAFAVTVWNGLNPHPGVQTDPTQQALPTNPIDTPLDRIASFTYTGNLNFNDPSGGTDTIGADLATGGGTLTAFTSGSQTVLNGTTFSGTNFTRATLMEISFTLLTAKTLNITHDDGISLWNSGNSVDFLNASSPTTAELSTVTVGPGSYNLWYAEVNGLPAILDVDATAIPEPVSMAIFASGLLGLAFTNRKRFLRK